MNVMLNKLIGKFRSPSDPFDIPIKSRSDYPTDDNMVPQIPEDDLIGVYPRDTAWGNNIKFTDFENRDVAGHKTVLVELDDEMAKIAHRTHMERPVRDGDLFGYEMESDRIAVFRLIGVDRQTDPRDMFFAKALDIGYMVE